jgi:hypothetical protein
MSANGWFALDKTQRLVPLTDEDISAPAEAVECRDRITLEKINFTATDIIRICFKDVPKPPPVVATPTRYRWLAIALALAAVAALACLV